MPVSFSVRLAVPADVLINVIDGQAVLLNLKTERYFGLDEVGTTMWQRLTTADSLEAAYSALLTEYEVEPARLRADLTEFTDRLIQNGLLEVRSG